MDVQEVKLGEGIGEEGQRQAGQTRQAKEDHRLERQQHLKEPEASAQLTSWFIWMDEIPIGTTVQKPWLMMIPQRNYQQTMVSHGCLGGAGVRPQ